MTQQRCQSCNSCGMPFEKAEDRALGNPQSEYCIYCTHKDGSLKPYEDVLGGMRDYLMQSQGIDKNAAQAIAEETLKKLPAWRTRA